MEVIEGSDTEVEFSNKVLVSGRKEGVAKVRLWSQFVCRLDNVNVVFAVHDRPNFGEDLFAGAEDVYVDAWKGEKRGLRPSASI